MSSTPPDPSGSHAALPSRPRRDGLGGDVVDELNAVPALRASRFPRWVLALAATLAALAVIAGTAYAAYRYNQDKPATVVTAGTVNTAWPLTPPLQVAGYSRNANANATPTSLPNSNKSAIATTYARNGRDSVVLLLGRPESDGRKFMEELGMTGVAATGDGFCGTTSDTGDDGCTLIRDNTAITVVDLAGLTRTDLMALTHTFADTLAG